MQHLKSENSALKIKMAQKLTTGAGNRPGTHRRRNRDGQSQGKEDFNLPTSNLVSLINLNTGCPVKIVSSCTGHNPCFKGLIFNSNECFEKFRN